MRNLFKRKPAETRAETRATLEDPRTTLADPAAWLVNFFGGGPSTASGVPVSEESAMRCATVYACARIIAESIASLPLQVYERTDSGTRLARDHPIYTLLHDEPNKLQTSYYFRETVSTGQALFGNGYAKIERQRATLRPEALIPLHPDRVEPKIVDRELVYIVRFDNGQAETIPADAMLHFPALGFDGIQGKSPIRLHREAIGLAQATERFGASFFSNGARLSGLLKHPGTFSSSAVADRILDQFTATYSGSNWGVAMLEEGMAFEPLSMPNDDAQFLETRKFQTADIARIFRIPRALLGDGDDRKANYEQQSLDFITYTLRPWLVRQEQEFNRKLFRPSERGRFYCEYNIDGLLRGDSAARAQFYKDLFNIGAFSQNDIRAKENLNPIEGGDRYFVPLNMVPIDRLDDQLDQQNNTESDPEPDQNSTESDPEPEANNADPAPDDRIARNLAAAAARCVVTRLCERTERGIKLLEADRVADFGEYWRSLEAQTLEHAKRQADRVYRQRDGAGESPTAAELEHWLAGVRNDIENLPADPGSWRGVFGAVFEHWRDDRLRALEAAIHDTITDEIAAAGAASEG